MPGKKKKEKRPVNDPELIKARENLLIEKEKRYQRKDRRPQVEKLTLLKEKKK